MEAILANMEPIKERTRPHTCENMLGIDIEL